MLQRARHAIGRGLTRLGRRFGYVRTEGFQFRPFRTSKVFCVGRNKTGTTSLKVALQELGYIMGDQREAERLIDAYAARYFTPVVGYCRSAEAFQDVPFSWPYTYVVLAGIREILLITTLHDRAAFERLLGDGSQLGLDLQYAVQPSPDGLAQTFLIGEAFIGDDKVCLILGDNVFYGQGFRHILEETVATLDGATIFGYRVQDPERSGMVEVNGAREAVSIEEKPARPKSNIAVTGLYFYDNRVVDIAKHITPSDRGDLDTGTHEAMGEASRFVEIIERRQGLKVVCIEEVAWWQGWITDEELLAQAEPLRKSGYGSYLMNLVT